jgi:hypothetical protein
VSERRSGGRRSRSARSTDGLTNRRDQGITGFLQAVDRETSLIRRNRTAFCTPANGRPAVVTSSWVCGRSQVFYS